MLSVLKDPLNSIKILGSTTPINLTVALHYYHMIFFDYLHTIDWIHHILMMYVGYNVYFNPEVGLVSNYIIFFINGFPGGLDYILLILNKYNFIQSLTEKKLNSYINIWIRSPGILIGTYCLYLARYIQPNYHPNLIDSLSIFGLLFWNAQYFTYRVVYNYSQRITEINMINSRDKHIKNEFSKELAKMVRSKSMGDLQDIENIENIENLKSDNNNNNNWSHNLRTYSDNILSILTKTIQTIRQRDIQRIEKEEKESRRLD